MSKSTVKFRDFLAAKGLAAEVRALSDSTRTAQQAADVLGCKVAQIAKSIVFRDVEHDEPILVIASGSNYIDIEKVASATGLTLEKATGNFVKNRLGFAIGGVPPAGHLVPVRTILDSDLMRLDQIWAAAGTPFAVFRLEPRQLPALTGGVWLDVAKSAG